DSLRGCAALCAWEPENVGVLDLGRDVAAGEPERPALLLDDHPSDLLGVSRIRVGDERQIVGRPDVVHEIDRALATHGLRSDEPDLLPGDEGNRVSIAQVLARNVAAAAAL